MEKLSKKIKKNEKWGEKIKDCKVSPRESDQSLYTLSKKFYEVKWDVDKFMRDNTYKQDTVWRKRKKY